MTARFQKQAAAPTATTTTTTTTNGATTHDPNSMQSLLTSPQSVHALFLFYAVT
jgi:hypothetical protein